MAAGSPAPEESGQVLGLDHPDEPSRVDDQDRSPRAGANAGDDVGHPIFRAGYRHSLQPHHGGHHGLVGRDPKRRAKRDEARDAPVRRHHGERLALVASEVALDRGPERKVAGDGRRRARHNLPGGRGLQQALSLRRRERRPRGAEQERANQRWPQAVQEVAVADPQPDATRHDQERDHLPDSSGDAGRAFEAPRRPPQRRPQEPTSVEGKAGQQVEQSDQDVRVGHDRRTRRARWGAAGCPCRARGPAGRPLRSRGS